MPYTVHVQPEVAVELVAWIQDAAAKAIAERGTFCMALPGGSVATTCFPALASSSLDWSRTHLFWGDERAVSPEDPESNVGLARRLLINGLTVAPQVHPMDAARADLAAAARDYEDVMRQVAPQGLDLALLGVGPDGHVCSLFVGHPLLEEREHWVATLTDSPKPPPCRMTLTLPALLAARTVAVVALGASKAHAVAEAVEDPTSSLPVALVLRGAKEGRLLLDGEAASRASWAI